MYGPGGCQAGLGAAVTRAAHGRCPVGAAAHPWVAARGGQCSACPATRVPVPVPADVRLAGGDPGSTPELAPGLAAELEAHVAGTVRALQEELWRVQERLSRLEMLGAAQVGAGLGRGQGWDTAPARPGQQGSAPGPGMGLARVWGLPRWLVTCPGRAEDGLP